MISNNDNIFTCRTDNGFSSVIGSEVCVIRDFYKGLFPKGYFKDYWIDTRWFSQEMESKDTFKKNKPILSIKPRPNIGMESSYFTRLPSYWYKNYYILKRLKDNYFPVLNDEDHGLFMYFLPERVKIDYEAEITLPTRMDMLNAAYHLKGSVLHDSYFYIPNTYLEVEIPRKYILALANSLDYDLNIPVQCDDFEEYLNYRSDGKITKKKKLSSGNYEYFFQYRVQILCRIDQDPELGDGEGNGQTESNFTVTSQIQTEFWSPFNFFLEVSDDNGKIKEFLYNYDKDSMVTNPDGSSVVIEDLGENKASVNLVLPIDEMMKSENAINIEGKQLVIWQGYLTEDNTVDELDFMDALSHEMQEVIRYNKENKIDSSNEFELKVYKDKELIPDRYIEVDWDRCLLKNFSPDENSTFHLAVYCDLPSIRTKAEKIRNEIGLS